MQTNVQEIVLKANNKLRDKNTRNTIFIILAVVLVLFINSLLPIIEGSAHYTEVTESMSYGEFLAKQSNDENYNLTYKSSKTIENWKKDYRKHYVESHPDVIEEEVPIPDLLLSVEVTVYTKFFFQSITWYVNTLLNIISVLIIYYSVFNYVLSKFKDTRERYTTLKKNIDTSVDENVDPNTFEPWMYDVFNKERKKAQHISNVKAQLDKLYNTTPYKIRVLECGKKHNAYVQKIKELEEKLTDEYIERYALNSRVKGYKPIYPSFVQSGINLKWSTSVDEYSLIRSDAGRVSSDGFKKVLTSIALTTVFALLLTFTASASSDKSWYWILINVFAKITPMIIQIPLAIDYADSFMNNQLIPVLQYRINIILLYLAYNKRGVTNEIK